MTGPSDLGRRIAHRRAELDKSQEGLAADTHMPLGYVEYIERHADPGISRVVVRRLARALDTDVAELLGGHAGVPPGGGSDAAPDPRLERLDVDDARRLLGERGVGRVVFDTERGPAAHPVNYVVVGGELIFRTGADSVVAAVVRAGGAVSFEVDRVDEPTRSGWSVLVRGESEMLSDQAADPVLSSVQLEPWAGGERDVVVRIHPIDLTGRRIETS